MGLTFLSSSRFVNDEIITAHTPLWRLRVLTTGVGYTFFISKESTQLLRYYSTKIFQNLARIRNDLNYFLLLTLTDLCLERHFAFD